MRHFHQYSIKGDMKMKGLNNKKQTLINSPEFTEILEVLQNQAKKVVELIQQACDPSSKAKLAIDALIVDIISCEKRIDRLKEAFTEKLYMKKGFLPSMQKNDYLFVVEHLDEVADEYEIIARQFQVYDFEFPDELKNDFIGLAEEVAGTVGSLVDHVVLLFKDFRMTQPAWLRVQEMRRNARESQWSLHGKLLALDIDVKQLIMQRALLKILINVADKAEDFSDSINALAIKYLAID